MKATVRFGSGDTLDVEDIDEPPNPEDLLNLRLLLAMYRQGWKDALSHLRVQTSVVDREFRDMYARLQPEVDSTIEEKQ